jgi:CheY-like chemotaxis protein
VASGRPLRNLVVEDNDDVREMLRVHLGLVGHEVHQASDGPTGIARAQTLAPDVALIDVGLPGLDGDEVARRIRASETDRTMRLVAITGYGQAEDQQRALDAGFDAHLTKPVTPERLAHAIAGGNPPRANRSATEA